jgi:hypothetical protein
MVLQDVLLRKYTQTMQLKKNKKEVSLDDEQWCFFRE